MTILTNIPSLNANRNLNGVNGKQTNALQKLSSGLRINRAADDTSGLAISEKMRTQIRGLNQAERNIQDGVSLLNVADGALQEAQDIVHRIRELAVLSCNDTNTEGDRRIINEEYTQLCQELENIAKNTEFNTRKLFTGDYAREIFKGLDIMLYGVIETDPPNPATSTLPPMNPSPQPQQASIVTEPPISGAIQTFPAVSATPKAQLSYDVDGNLRPPRDLLGTVNDLTGDWLYNSGSNSTVDNIGGKIVATAGTDELNVGNNTSYNNDMDVSYYIWQWQRSDWEWNPAKGAFGWSDPYDYDTEKVITIEDHSEYGVDGGIADAPARYYGKDIIIPPTVKYTYLPTPIESYQPTVKETTGNTDYDYLKDEWERAEIYSEALITNVTNNNGGVVYVDNNSDVPPAETHVTNNTATRAYNLGTACPPHYPHALVDTNTKIVTVDVNFSAATVISRSQVSGSTFTSTTNSGPQLYGDKTISGTIYSGAETTTVDKNDGALYVNSNGSIASNLNVTTNSGTVYANSYIAEIGSNSRSATIVQLNSDQNGAAIWTPNLNPPSSFNLTGTNDGKIKTDAQDVTVNDNSIYGSLVTTNTNGTLTVNINSGLAGWGGAIATQASTVNITANNGRLLIQNSNATATIGSTNANSVIDTSAQQLNINGDANGSIRVEAGANVVINGDNNAEISILSNAALGGGTVTVNGNLGGTTTVESGATLNITGNITGTLYIQPGATVNFTGINPLTITGTIVFLEKPAGLPASFSPQPLNVATGGTVELQSTSTTHINIGENNGTVKMFNSTATIADNKGTLQVNDSSTATVSANSGAILNLGKVVPDGSANTGTIDNWGKINPAFTNASGSITHHAPFATDNGMYDVSGVKFPNVVNGELAPSVQTSVIRLTQNGIVYTLTAEWKATNATDDLEFLCDCVIGTHDKDGCTDHDSGLVADAFELIFDIDSISPKLQQGEQFVFEPDPVLNAAGMRYDIAGRNIVYNVDGLVSLSEVWEDGNNNGLWIQTGANTGQGHNVYLPDLTRMMSDITISCAICDCSSLKSANLLDLTNATGALRVCDLTNSNISKVRGYIGSQINRLTYAGNADAISSENLSSSESRIRDTDMAKEMMTYTKSNVLLQAGMSLLAQSNQNPQMILQLLR